MFIYELLKETTNSALSSIFGGAQIMQTNKLWHM
jgi:hypothetical protein